MIRRRCSTLVGVALVLWSAVALAPVVARAVDTLPVRLTDAEFWRLSGDLSEPNGSFRSDNLLSNELRYPEILSDLVSRVKPGGVYLGVGPEQNFNYIVAIKPRMAFITDIRRGNLHAQLMYKALFEMSADRAEFVSRLFSKPRPPSLSSTITAPELMRAYWDVQTSPQTVYEANLQAIKDHLTKTHTLPLPKDDLDGIEYVYFNFYWFGPSITYNSSSGSSNGGRGGASMATYDQLMSVVDRNGTPVSYLQSEEAFRFMKDLEARNLIVPVVGDFGGPKALRAVGQYVRDHGATVSAFYLSNVEQYLRQDNIWEPFCANVASMPLDEQSTFIRSQSGGGGGAAGFVNMLGAMQAETRGCAPNLAPSRVAAR